MKRVIAMLLSAVFLVSAMPGVLAEDISGADKNRELLDALGIMSIESTSEFVTRQEFFGGLLYMAYEDYDEEVLRELLVERGILFDTSDSLFAGDKYISYNDAIAAVATMLGYDKIAKIGGEYPDGYIKAARENGLLSGVSGNRTLSLDRNSIVNLFINAIEAEPFVVSFAGKDVIGEFAKDETVLSVERDIYEVEGIVEANQYTSLIDALGNAKEQITINGEKYYINGTDADKLLGYSVKGYIQKDDEDDGKVIYLFANQNKTSELIIDSENIVSVTDDCRKVKYQREGTNSVKTVNVSSKVRVIYNGKFYDEYTKDDFIPGTGTLKLVDNNGDREYDCAFISSYETMIVDYITDKNEIYGQYTYPDALNYIKFEEKDDNPNIHYYLGDEEVDFSKIAKDDVITILRSKGDADVVADVHISRNVIVGSAEKYDPDEDIIKIEGKEYRVSDVFYNEAKALGGITLSTRYSFYFDFFGELVYVERESATDYCLFYKIFENEETEHGYSMKYMNDNSEWITAPLAKKVNYNETRYDTEVIYRELFGAKPQVMLIKQNQNGEVNYIATAVAGKTGSHPITKTSEQTMNYHSNPAAFDYNLFLEKTAKVFVIPSASDVDCEDFYVTTRGYFRSDRNYKVTAYDVDEFNFADVLSVSLTATEVLGTPQAEIMVVTDVYTTLNADDEPVTKIECTMGAYSGLEYEVLETANPDGLKKGSVIRIHLDKTKKRIDNWVNVIDNLDKLDESMRDERYFYGKVLASDPVGGKVRMECDGLEGVFRHGTETTVLICDVNAKTCEVGSAKDIVPGDNIYMYAYFAVSQNIVIIKD